ncbi:pyruvate dehydrogenase subunit beta [Christensenellaceae bacterium]|nr:pyruvate dehydrogenase subunit beta [Christensenellaceae bacterium]BDF60630.1 pyruvate dehydrogenase subunit beta [Christensenellaceae bacterium]
MEKMFYGVALKTGIENEMKKDPMVFVAGEDVGNYGGCFGQTKGLFEEFGGWRVLDTPISETAIIGLGCGAAAAGMRPVVELMYIDFAGVAMDEIMNQVAKMRYMFGGKCKMPLVIRASCGAGSRLAAQHSQMLESMFTHIPGLKVVCPATPADAKGLMQQAIRDDNPVLYLENKVLLNSLEGEVPDGDYYVPFGKANIMREGKDITIVAWSMMVHRAMEAAEELAKQGVSAEVIDARTLVPFDKETLFDSIRKTHRLAIVQEDTRTCGFASEIVTMVAETCIDELEENIIRITAPDCPVPYSPVLEDAYVPSSEKVVSAIMEIF